MSVTTPINIGMHIHEVTKPPSPEAACSPTPAAIGPSKAAATACQIKPTTTQAQSTARNIGRQAIGKKKPTVLPQWVDVLPD